MRRRSHRLQRGMRIAVIGKGNIGGSLGSKWRAAGHDVVYGARDGSGEGPGGGKGVVEEKTSAGTAAWPVREEGGAAGVSSLADTESGCP